jgi:hypothetical protein
MEGHVMKRTRYVVYDLILATATTAGLTVVMTAAVMFSGAKLTAADAQTDVSFARDGMTVAATSNTARPQAAHTPQTRATGSRVGVGDIDSQRDRTATARGGSPQVVRAAGTTGAAASVPESRALGLFALGLLVTAGRLSVVERRRASTPFTALPVADGETAAPAR